MTARFAPAIAAQSLRLSGSRAYICLVPCLGPARAEVAPRRGAAWHTPGAVAVGADDVSVAELHGAAVRRGRGAGWGAPSAGGRRRCHEISGSPTAAPSLWQCRLVRHVLRMDNLEPPPMKPRRVGVWTTVGGHWHELRQKPSKGEISGRSSGDMLARCRLNPTPLDGETSDV